MKYEALQHNPILQTTIEAYVLYASSRFSRLLSTDLSVDFTVALHLIADSDEAKRSIFCSHPDEAKRSSLSDQIRIECFSPVVSGESNEQRIFPHFYPYCLFWPICRKTGRKNEGKKVQWSTNLLQPPSSLSL
ncbi:hypothetical protein L1887_12387 [Cichorium endivia]|nr:hypothetical protein L1887_12387 [Cichorium endivia]